MLLSTARVLEDHLASLDLSAVLVSGKAPFGCCYPKSVRRVLIRTTAAPCSDEHAATRNVVCHWILDNQQGPEAPTHLEVTATIKTKSGHQLLTIQPCEQQHPPGKSI